jgi:hypothetical protein
MAVQNATIKQNVTTNSGDFAVATYTSMANGDTGAPLGQHDFIDRVIQFAGTWGSGGTAVWEGSNDGVNWQTLVDPNGNAISLTANGMKQCAYTPVYSRPHMTAGDGTTAIVCTVSLRRFRSGSEQ